MVEAGEAGVPPCRKLCSTGLDSGVGVRFSTGKDVSEGRRPCELLVPPLVAGRIGRVVAMVDWISSARQSA